MIDLPIPGNSPGRLAFSSDGTVLAVAEPAQHRVVLWDLANQGTVRVPAFFSGPARNSLEAKPLRSIEDAAATALCFAPDGKTLAIGSGLRIGRYEVATGKPLDARQGHLSAVTALSVCPNGQLVASGDVSGTVYVWESGTGRPLHALAAGRGKVHALAFSPDGRSLATTSNLTPTPVASPGGPANAGAQGTPSLATIRLWDVRSGKEIHCFVDKGKPVAGLDFSPDGQMLAAGGPNGAIVIWNVATKKQAHQVVPNGEVVKSLQFLPGGKALLLVADNGGSWVYRLDTRELLGTSRPDRSLAVFSPDGRFVIAQARLGGVFALRDRATDSAIRFIGTGGEKFNVATTTCSADGQLLAAVSNDRHVTLWEIASGKEVLRWRLDGVSTRLTFHPNGKALVAAGSDGVPLIWELAPLVREPDGATTTDELWSGLLADDARLAYQAAWTLSTRGKAAVAFLRNRLQPAEASKLTAAELDRLVAALDSNRFAEREQAMNTLRDQGQELVPYVQKVLTNWSSVEVKVRLERLLIELEQVILKPTTLRTVRAIRVLEQVGSPEAEAVLQVIVKGDPKATETREAVAAMERLQRQRMP